MSVVAVYGAPGIRLSEEVQFKPNSFRIPPEAIPDLKSIVGNLRMFHGAFEVRVHPDARDGARGPGLARKRAAAVRAALIHLGMPHGRLRADTSPMTVADPSTDGDETTCHIEFVLVQG
jgi:outer membrane protein OmpA-like peptidoglycan-associated protein